MRYALLFTLTAGAVQAGPCGGSVTVASGDTLSAIAARCDVPLADLMAQNPTADANHLEIGQVLRLSGGDGVGGYPVVYTDRIMGAYSPQSVCQSQELQVEFTGSHVYIGETACAIAAMSSAGAGVVINAIECQSEGEPSGDRLIEVYPIGQSGTVSVDFGRGNGATNLKRCTDR